MATRKEVMIAVTRLEAEYAGYFRNMDTNLLREKIALWSEMLESTDSRMLDYAVKFWIANNTSGFPPTVGQINQIIREALEPEALTELEAWQMVKKAIRNSSEMEDARREWNALPEDVRAPLKPSDLMEWGQLKSDIVNTTISAAYRRSYTAKRQRVWEQKALPESTRLMIAGGGE